MTNPTEAIKTIRDALNEMRFYRGAMPAKVYEMVQSANLRCAEVEAALQTSIGGRTLAADDTPPQTMRSAESWLKQIVGENLLLTEFIRAIQQDALNSKVPQWQTMNNVPRDGTHVLLYTTDHGCVEAWFDVGEWTDHHEYGREYSGAAWVCGDDKWQIEVEKYAYNEYHDGTATHWTPLLSAPKAGE